MDKYVILNKLKSLVAAIGGAIVTAVIHWIENEAGIQIDDSWKVAAVSAVTGLILQQLVYWVPNAHKPMGE